MINHPAIIESESSLVGLRGEPVSCPREPYPLPPPEPPEEPTPPRERTRKRSHPRLPTKRCACGNAMHESSECCNDCAKRERYNPTPEEIKAECAAIRANWTDLDWIHRCGRELEVGVKVLRDPRLNQ